MQRGKEIIPFPQARPRLPTSAPPQDGRAAELVPVAADFHEVAKGAPLDRLHPAIISRDFPDES